MADGFSTPEEIAESLRCVQVSLMDDQEVTLLDCTLRDGGYYTNWDFDRVFVHDYLHAMVAAKVKYVEIGFRSCDQQGFRGAHAFTRDDYLRSLTVPSELSVGVMVNASEVLKDKAGLFPTLERLFARATESPVAFVRFACHAHEFERILPGCDWLKHRGYMVGINLMQIADRQPDEIENLARMAEDHPLDVLYFADSMGSLSPESTHKIIGSLRKGWRGALGIHTHDNRGMALANSLQAINDGVCWIDGTVAGMGRGPGNARTEYLAIELMAKHRRVANVSPLLKLVSKYFQALQQRYGWGTNPYYYLAGTYGIHPTYIQEMLSDARFAEEDLLVVIDFLRSQGGKKFDLGTLESARHFYCGTPRGSWSPESVMAGREVLILGSGPGVTRHCQSLEDYIRRAKPFVIALNTQQHLAPELINVRAACHPFRLMADCKEHLRLPQPLVTPASMLPEDVREALVGKELLDFGLTVEVGRFAFANKYCTLPTSLVAAYALAIATSGRVSRILLAGFDGYSADDPRTTEVNQMFDTFQNQPNVPPLLAVTPSRYQIPISSIYAL